MDIGKKELLFIKWSIKAKDNLTGQEWKITIAIMWKTLLRGKGIQVFQF